MGEMASGHQGRAVRWYLMSGRCFGNESDCAIKTSTGINISNIRLASRIFIFIYRVCDLLQFSGGVAKI